MKKKVDSRIRTLIENGVKTRHRTLIVLVGDKGKDQIVNLHYILSKAAVKSRPSVLWCYKKELELSSHKKKRMRQIKKQIQRGLLDPNKDDPFELFVSSTQIRWCYYKETQKILGSTYGMCVLQDFETLTPNLLARTVETVEGGGVIVLLLRTMTSLRQLYTMTMESHERYRTEGHSQVVGRFNERFLLSLGGCSDCLVVDDELNILPLSSHVRDIRPIEQDDGEQPGQTASRELRELQASLADTETVGSLVGIARTVDQARAVLTFVETISEKVCLVYSALFACLRGAVNRAGTLRSRGWQTLRSTVALTAGRGRGKSAALGLALAAAVAHGYSNIFVTSPSPEVRRLSGAASYAQ
jgi:N-acetyltransferase 10